MSDVVARRCDGPHCDRIKSPANHWVTIQVILWEDVQTTIVLGTALVNFDRLEASANPRAVAPMHFCGEGCLYRYLSKQLKLPPPAAEENNG